jgi:hypothetical protein
MKIQIAYLATDENLNRLKIKDFMK